ncbi:hypothetical protein EU556_17250 [Hymenobacter fodinae]|uniref:Uncharacterized protein n=1 Tax=Hymenobacter fodinae TaxID=2510796 RepID=A0A4Z0P7D1_9BACT|nr:hypothetical protein EU556_17250 [Hymenobacter fodinae]
MKFEYRFLSEFMTEFLVKCPNCDSKGVVATSFKDTWQASFICITCSSHRLWSGNSSSFVTAHSNYDQYDGILSGPAVDCFFRYPLWYQAEYKGNVLYAYNLVHLNWLRLYLEAKLRERVQTLNGWSNQSLQSRIPQWMLIAKNRAAIIKKIKALERK